MAKDRSLSIRRLLLTAGVLALGFIAQQAGIDPSRLGFVPGATPAEAPRSEVEARIERAFASRQSGFMVTLDARVLKRLRDDLDGSRHQRFLISLATGRTLLVAHNLDLAARIPLDVGDAIRVRGQYEWNEQGGVIHWTHHDPAGRHPAGWIEHDGLRVE